MPYDVQLTLKHDPNTIYMSTEDYQEERQSTKHCSCCGHEIPNKRKYCDKYCQKRYLKRKKEFLNNL